MTRDAQAIWITGMRQITIRAEELAMLSDEDIAITTTCSAISHGTEMLVYRGQVPADLALDLPTFAGSFAFPIKYGYALVGEVSACGAAVTSSPNLRDMSLLTTATKPSNSPLMPAGSR